MEFVTRGATRLLMAEDIAGGAVRYLAEHGLKQFGYQDWITARAPDDNEQRFFGVGHEVTVFEIFRTAFDQDKMPMRVTVTVFPADRNQFIVNVGDDPRPSVRESGTGLKHRPSSAAVSAPPLNSSQRRPMGDDADVIS